MKDLTIHYELTVALKTGPLDVRSAAADMLGRLNARASVPVLIDALGDEEALVRTAALKSLRAISKRRFGPDQSRWREWWRSGG